MNHPAFVADRNDELFRTRYGGFTDCAGVLSGGGCRGAGDSQDARWGAEPVDAGSGWEPVGGEVSEQSAALKGAGE